MCNIFNHSYQPSISWWANSPFPRATTWLCVFHDFGMLFNKFSKLVNVFSRSLYLAHCAMLSIHHWRRKIAGLLLQLQYLCTITAITITTHTHTRIQQVATALNLATHRLDTIIHGVVKTFLKAKWPPLIWILNPVVEIAKKVGLTRKHRVFPTGEGLLGIEIRSRIAARSEKHTPPSAWINTRVWGWDVSPQANDIRGTRTN